MYNHHSPFKTKLLYVRCAQDSPVRKPSLSSLLEHMSLQNEVSAETPLHNKCAGKVGKSTCTVPLSLHPDLP